MKIKQINFKFSDTKKKWWQFWKKDTYGRWTHERFAEILKIFDKYVKWDKLMNVVMSPDALTVCSTIGYVGDNDELCALITNINKDEVPTFEKFLNYHGTYPCIVDLYAQELDDDTKDGCTYIAFRYIDGSMLIINFTEAVFKKVPEGQSFEW